MVLLTADSSGLISAFGPPQWGIFDQSGSPVLIPDSVADVEYERDYKISDYPQEKGAFQSYNKVQVPFRARVGFYIAQTRESFLQTLDAKIKSLDLVTVAMPEIQYPSANLTRASYRREVRSGVSLIRVEVWCEEVRIVSGVVPSDPQSTNGVKSQSSGQVQAVPTTQVAPVASEASVGGPFQVEPALQSPVGLAVSPDLRNVSGTMGLPEVPNYYPSIPPGIPSTGGEASSQLPPTRLEFTEPQP